MAEVLCHRAGENHKPITEDCNVYAQTTRVWAQAVTQLAGYNLNPHYKTACPCRVAMSHWSVKINSWPILTPYTDGADYQAPEPEEVL